MMGEIFESAEKVFAWIGSGNQMSDALFRAIQRQGTPKASRQHWNNLSDVDETRFAQGFHDVLTRPFWSRLWILQEIALAKQVAIVCGDYLIAWQDLEVPDKKYAYAGYSPRTADRTVLRENSRTWEQLRRTNTLKAKKSTLGAIVQRFYQAKYSDPRDKVFGLLSMADYTDRSALPVDYRKDAFEVLVDFWQRFVSRQPNREQVKDRHIPGLVWQLWLHMELDCAPEYFSTQLSHSNTVERILGSEGFKVRSRFLKQISGFTRTELHTFSSMSSWTYARYIRWLQVGDLCLLSTEFEEGYGGFATRYWLASSSEGRFQPDDFCFVIDSQPSDALIDGGLETVPNQSLVVARIIQRDFHCIGKGQEISSIDGGELSGQLIVAYMNHVRESAQYRLHPGNAYAYGILPQNTRCMNPRLLLNAAAVCEVMQTPWSFCEFAAVKDRPRNRFGGRHSEDLPHVLQHMR